nr:histidine phosphatase family protein [Lactobacillus kimbladii]
MKYVYLMRNGQTLFNVQHKIQGFCDSPLTSLGIKQAKEPKKEYFEHEKVKLEEAHFSVLKYNYENNVFRLQSIFNPSC